MRVEQPQGTKGSLKWIQAAVARPTALDQGLRATIGLSREALIDWRSPRADDRWSEYRDAAFLETLGLDHLAPALDRFWPRRGPQWDALATVSTGEVILLEAKSHPAEMSSSCAASPASRTRIEAALHEAKIAYGATPDSDWTAPYYQYANRLAHLHFLRQQGVPAHLIFVYFLNDQEMDGPDSREAWAPAIAVARDALGLSDGLTEAVHEMFLDVGDCLS
jgi:hypothetical protein